MGKHTRAVLCAAWSNTEILAMGASDKQVGPYTLASQAVAQGPFQHQGCYARCQATQAHTSNHSYCTACCIHNRKPFAALLLKLVASASAGLLHVLAGLFLSEHAEAVPQVTLTRGSDGETLNTLSMRLDPVEVCFADKKEEPGEAKPDSCTISVNVGKRNLYLITVSAHSAMLQVAKWLVTCMHRHDSAVPDLIAVHRGSQHAWLSYTFASRCSKSVLSDTTCACQDV